MYKAYNGLNLQILRLHIFPTVHFSVIHMDGGICMFTMHGFMG